ncbi:MAG: ribonuclease Z [Candidatus Micrarchaeia archaeon]
MKIVFLGTSGSAPTKERNLPSVALEYNGEIILFDCGEGTQRQMIKNSLNLSKINKIFISHIHGDHIIGLAGIVRTLALNNREKALYVFVPKGEEKGIKALLTFDKIKLNYPIIINEIKSGIIDKNKDYIIKAFKLKHSIPTYGFIFKELDKLRFYKDKCTKYGIKGTMFIDLKEKGFININNKKIFLKDITYKKEGKKIVYATDTRPTNNTINAAKDSNLLIHEATYADENKDLAKERKHSTATEAATIAKKANCKKLALFHISSRYHSIDMMKKEATKIFKNTIIPNDGDILEI